MKRITQLTVLGVLVCALSSCAGNEGHGSAAMEGSVKAAAPVVAYACGPAPTAPTTPTTLPAGGEPMVVDSIAEADSLTKTQTEAVYSDIMDTGNAPDESPTLDCSNLVLPQTIIDYGDTGPAKQVIMSNGIGAIVENISFTESLQSGQLVVTGTDSFTYTDPTSGKSMMIVVSYTGSKSSDFGPLEGTFQVANCAGNFSINGFLS